MFDSMKGFKAIVEGGGGGGPGGWEDGRGGGLEHLIFKMGIPFVWYREYAFLLVSTTSVLSCPDHSVRYFRKRKKY